MNDILVLMNEEYDFRRVGEFLFIILPVKGFSLLKLITVVVSLLLN